MPVSPHVDILFLETIQLDLPAFAEEAVLVAGDELGFDLAHGVEHDADDDQERRAAEELANFGGIWQGQKSAAFICS